MDDQILDRRNLLRGAGLAGATVLGAATVAAPASADEGRRGVIGAWLITHTDDPVSENTPVQAVAAFTPGGVLLTQDISPAAPGGMGAWEPRGDGRFAGLFYTGETDESGASVVVQVRVRGRTNGDRIHGTYLVTGFVNGDPAFTGTGTFQGRRIDV